VLSEGLIPEPNGRVEGGGTTLEPGRPEPSEGLIPEPDGRVEGGASGPRSVGFITVGGVEADPGPPAAALSGLSNETPGSGGRPPASGRPIMPGRDKPVLPGAGLSPPEGRPFSESSEPGRPSRSLGVSGRPKAGGRVSLVARSGRRSGRSLGNPRTSLSYKRSRIRSVVPSSPGFRQPRSMCGRSMLSRTCNGSIGRSLAAITGAATINRSLSIRENRSSPKRRSPRELQSL